MSIRDRLRAGRGETIVGLVHPQGPGLSHSRGDKHWQLLVRFDAWRRPGDLIDQQQLVLTKRGSKEGLSLIRDSIRPYDVVRVTAVLEEAGGGELLDVLGPDADEELGRRSAELRRPVTAEIEPFGVLTYDRRLDWWETVIQWTGSEVELSLDPGDDGDVYAVARFAQRLWEDQVAWDDRVRSRAATDLLETYNEWQEGHGPTLTASELASRPKLESVVVWLDGSFEFSFDDDGLFLGHTIIVGGTVDDGALDAHIAG